MNGSLALAWFTAIRPRTLSAAVAPVLVGTGLTAALGFAVHWGLSLWALLASLSIQVGTNLVNDVIDFRRGTDDENRIGPKRLLQSKQASPGFVMIIGSLFFMVALLAGIPLVIHGGWPIFWIGLLSIAMGYSYTAGPFPLAYLGLGDLFVILFFGIIAVAGIVYLHTGHFFVEALWAGFQIGCLATVLIAINNFRDRAGDLIANKKTLAVRFGANFVRTEILFLFAFAFIGQIYWGLRFGWTFIWILPCCLIPKAIWILKHLISEKPSEKFNAYLGTSGKIHLAFSLLQTAAFFFSKSGMFR